MSAAFAYVDHEERCGLELYYEDDKIALNTFEHGGMSSHEIMLSPRVVELLIEALTEMQATIRTRYQKAITA